jgi:hypothetical protein
MKALGEKWKQMAEFEKKPYQDIAQKDNRRYEYETKNAMNCEATQGLFYKKTKKGKGTQSGSQIMPNNA